MNFEEDNGFIPWDNILRDKIEGISLGIMNLETGEMLYGIHPGYRLQCVKDWKFRGKYREYYHLNPSRSHVRIHNADFRKLYEANLSCSEIKVFFAIVSKQNGFERQGVTIDTIMETAGVSEKTTRLAVTKLTEKDLIVDLGTRRARSYSVNETIIRCGEIEKPLGYKASDGEFVKISVRAMALMCRMQWTSEAWKLFWFCANYSMWNTNMIGYRNGRALQRQTISDACNLRMDAIEKAMQWLVLEEIVATDGEKTYLNPYCAAKGNRIDVSVAARFNKTKFKDAYDDEQKTLLEK